MAFLIELQRQSVRQRVDVLAPTLTLLIRTRILATVISTNALFYLLEYLDETLGVFGELIEIADGQFVQVEEWRGFVFLCLLLLLLSLMSPRGSHHNRGGCGDHLVLLIPVEVAALVVVIMIADGFRVAVGFLYALLILLGGRCSRRCDRLFLLELCNERHRCFSSLALSRCLLV